MSTNNYGDCNGMALKGAINNPVAGREPSLRERIGEITEILIAASNYLADAGMNLYIPKPQKDCCNEAAPCGNSLEYGINQLGQLACVVRDRAMEVNSRI